MSQFQVYGPASGGSTGDVVGPALSTDNAIARWDGITGKLLQNSVAILSDTGALSGLTSLVVLGPTQLFGAQSVKRRATAIDGTILLTDYYIGVTSVGAPRNYTLDAAGQVYVSGQTWIVKDEGGDAAANVITITPNSGTIDGAASTVINGNYDSLNILYDGTNYWTF